MKKYIIFAASALCFAAVSNAQASQKQSGINSNPTMAVHTVAMTKSAQSTSVAADKKGNASQQTAIKRKHHHKKTVHPKKMVDKK